MAGAAAVGSSGSSATVSCTVFSRPFRIRVTATLEPGGAFATHFDFASLTAHCAVGSAGNARTTHSARVSPTLLDASPEVRQEKSV